MVSRPGITDRQTHRFYCFFLCITTPLSLPRTHTPPGAPAKQKRKKTFFTNYTREQKRKQEEIAHTERRNDATNRCCCQADFARAAKVISGKELSPECVWLVFKIFDRGADGKLDHDELIEATRERLRRLPGQRDSPGSIARFVQCARGDSVK